MLTWADGLPSWAWLGVVVLLVPLSCTAQSISGVVYDPEGAVVPQSSRHAHAGLHKNKQRAKAARPGSLASPISPEPTSCR